MFNLLAADKLRRVNNLPEGPYWRQERESAEDQVQECGLDGRSFGSRPKLIVKLLNISVNLRTIFPPSYLPS